MAAWVADRVLPFLAKHTDDDSTDPEKSQPQLLAAEITEVSSTVIFVEVLFGKRAHSFHTRISGTQSAIPISRKFQRIPSINVPTLRGEIRGLRVMDVAGVDGWLCICSSFGSELF